MDRPDHGHIVYRRTQPTSGGDSLRRIPDADCARFVDAITACDAAYADIDRAVRAYNRRLRDLERISADVYAYLLTIAAPKHVLDAWVYNPERVCVPMPEHDTLQGRIEW